MKYDDKKLDVENKNFVPFSFVIESQKRPKIGKEFESFFFRKHILAICSLKVLVRLNISVKTYRIGCIPLQKSLSLMSS